MKHAPETTPAARTQVLPAAEPATTTPAAAPDTGGVFWASGIVARWRPRRRGRALVTLVGVLACVPLVAAAWPLVGAPEGVARADVDALAAGCGPVHFEPRGFWQADAAGLARARKLADLARPRASGPTGTYPVPAGVDDLDVAAPVTGLMVGESMRRGRTVAWVARGASVTTMPSVLVARWDAPAGRPAVTLTSDGMWQQCARLEQAAVEAFADMHGGVAG